VAAALKFEDGNGMSAALLLVRTSYLSGGTCPVVASGAVRRQKTAARRELAEEMGCTRVGNDKNNDPSLIEPH
jgi:hypothetical protein